MADNVFTPEFRVSYPNLFKTRKNELSGADEYGVTALFAKGADLSKLHAAAKEAIEKKWGADKAKWPKNLRSPFRDQAEKAKKNDKNEDVLPAGHEAGAIFLNLKTKQKPGLVSTKRSADDPTKPAEITDESEIYAGCYAVASVSCYTYDQKGNRGVSFGLRNMQKTRDGDPLGNRTRAQDDFAPVEAVSGGAGSSASDIFA